MTNALKLDIDLFKNDDNLWDIEIDTNGDLKGSNSIDTAVLMSLFTDKRADASEIRDSKERRGWWGNLFNDNEDYEIGSKLWLSTNQGRLTDDTLNAINSQALNCLVWMKEDNIVDDIKVSSNIIGNEQVRLNLKFIIGSNIINKYFILWENSRWQ